MPNYVMIMRDYPEKLIFRYDIHNIYIYLLKSLNFIKNLNMHFEKKLRVLNCEIYLKNQCH